MTPAERVRGFRQRLGITQESLARLLGVTVSTVNRWENGHSRPSPMAIKGMIAVGRTLKQPFMEGTSHG